MNRFQKITFSCLQQQIRSNNSDWATSTAVSLRNLYTKLKFFLIKICYDWTG